MTSNPSQPTTPRAPCPSFGREPLSRRDVLKAGVSLVAGLAAPRALGAASRPKTVVVVGGGIGGLSCAYELMLRGHDVTVLEASGRTGGHVKTLRDPLPDGLYADLGAEQFTRPGYEECWRYIEAFGLTPMRWRREENVYRRDKNTWIPEKEYFSRARLKARGFNPQELDYVDTHGWHNLAFLYLDPYVAKIKDEYQPLGVGMDELDRVPAGDFLAQVGASDAAARSCFRVGGRRSSPDKPPASTDVSALFHIWGAAIFRLRGLPYGPTELYHLKGGNERLTDALAAKLGDRIRRNCRVQSIRQGDSSVHVRCEDGGRKEELVAGYAVLAVSPMLLPTIEFSPPLSAAKRFALGNTNMGLYSRVLLQTATPFWRGDIPSINLITGDRHMPSVSETAEDVPGPRRVLFGVGMAAQTPDATVEAFRNFYPGNARDTIERCLVYQWWKEEPTCYGCERRPFPLGQLAAVWPHVIAPAGRIHFVGAAFDNLWRGMDAATRSAVRAARAIDAA